MQKSPKIKLYVAIAIPVLAVVGFVEDIQTRQGIDDWIWYLLALVMTIFVGGRFLPLLLAAVFSVMTLAGYHLSPAGSEPGLALGNCWLGIGVLWILAAMIHLQKRGGAALQKSEQRYRRLFKNMQEGVAHFRTLFEGDKLQDFIFLDVNSSFEEIVRLNRCLGKRITEIVPNIREARPEIFEIFGRVALTGQPEKFEYHLMSADVWVNISVYSMAKDELVATFEDITKRKEAYEEVHKLSCAVEQSPASIVITDPKGRIEYVNRKFCDVTGYSAADVIGKNPRILKSGETTSENYKQLWDTIKSGGTWHGEFHNRKKNGELYWEAAAISPILNATGEITHFLAVKEDITGTKRTQEELIWKTAFLEAEVDSALDGILVVNDQAKILLHNRRLVELFKVPGHIAENDDDRRLLQWVTDQTTDPELFLERVTYLYAHPDEIGRDEIRLKFGTVLDRYSAPVRSETGKCYGRIWTFRDITAGKQAEQRIRDQATLLDKASDAIWVIDLNDRVTYWNKGAEVLYGWSAAEAIGKKPLELLFKGTLTSQLQECIKTVHERGEWAGELEQFTKDGKPVTVHGRGNIIYDDEDRKKGVLIINSDITEKKKLEAQFLRGQRMESIGTLAGGIAHDLNNVLAPLVLSIELLMEQVTDKDGQHLLELMRNNVQRGANLVKQVLTFSRGVKGDRVSIQPNRVVREIAQIIKESFPKSVRFESHLDADLWGIIGDSTQLHQVLLNLCINARDAMPSGGCLTIEGSNVDFDDAHSAMIPGSKPGPYVVIKVADTGTGMTKEVQDRIFEPFFTTKSPGKGTGLGLSTSLGIIKSHCGFITCYSEFGKGTTFNVYFPANLKPSAENTNLGPTNLPQGHDELVLLVDDEESIRKTAEKVLGRFGYRVLLAANGAEAVSIYATRQREIAAVITDMSMPVMDGSTAIAKIRNINPNAKIIVASGLPVAGGMNPPIRSATEIFIGKPYSPDVILRTLHDVLN